MDGSDVTVDYLPWFLCKRKQCTCCLNRYPVHARFFGKHPGARDGFRNQCKRCRSVYYKKWRDEHREYKTQYDLAYHRSHPERRKIICANYYLRNKAACLARARQWYLRNRSKAQALTHRRRMRTMNLAATLTPADWLEILEHYNHSCAYCGIHQTELPMSLAQEHIIPVKRGGTFTRSNIVPACKSCNSKKGAHTPDEVNMRLSKPPLAD